MPKIRRQGVPPDVLNHLLDRQHKWNIAYSELQLFANWLSTNPEVPEGAWYKWFKTFCVCGKGELVITFLPKGRLPAGQQIF